MYTCGLTVVTERLRYAMTPRCSLIISTTHYAPTSPELITNAVAVVLVMFSVCPVSTSQLPIQKSGLAGGANGVWGLCP